MFEPPQLKKFCVDGFLNVTFGKVEKVKFEGNLGEMIYHSPMRDGNRVALYDANEKKFYTRGEIHDKSKRLAIGLREIGLCSVDVVAIVSENNINNALVVNASLYIGARVQPINPRNGDGDIVRQLTLTEPKIIFCTKEYYEIIKECKIKHNFIFTRIFCYNTPEFSKIMNVDEANYNKFSPTRYGLRNEAFIIATSGTTGQPKYVVLNHHFMVRMCICFVNQNYGNVSSSDVIVNVFPLYEMAGLMLFVGHLYTKCQMVLMSHYAPQPFLNYNLEFRATMLFISTKMAKDLHKNHYDDSSRCFKSIRDSIIGGGVLKESYYPNIRNQLGEITKPRTIYFMAEALITLQRTGTAIEPKSIGQAMPGLLLKVSNLDTGKNCAPNEKGEIRVKGHMVAKRYFGDDVNTVKLTKKAFDNQGFFRTGDYGYLDKCGNFYLLDRVKDLINFKGMRIEPSEIESVILKHPHVKDCGVIAVPDASCGQVPCAFVSLEEDSKIGPEDIKWFVVRSAPKDSYHLLGGCEIVQTIPRCQKGGVLRRALVQRLKKT